MRFLQPLGRALMLPIAVLPIAGLLLRLGQPDMLDIAFVGAAGEAIFSNLGLLFAIGVAAGFARDGNGAAALAGVVCFLVAGKGAGVLIAVPAETTAGLAAPLADLATAAFRSKAIAKLEVPIGIVSGIVGGLFYNRYSAMKLPEYLAFFGGRRFVPIVAGLAGLAIAALVGFGYGAISGGIDSLSRGIAGAGGFGLFAFGVLNRLLLVTGLHHVLNNIAWFVVGDYNGTTGDLRRFFAGDPQAGAFMSGFFPVMMFGLPAACLAMYRTALPERRKAVGGLLLSLALTSFLTGVTEPIEFSFMFLAPVLYAIHAVLTGVSMALMDALGVHLGFGFSAGLFDYALNFGKSTRPLLLLPVGAAYFAIYYGLFRLAIVKLDLPTPGREPLEGAAPAAPVASSRGAGFVTALGGAANLTSVDACTTRLRLIVVDQAAIDAGGLKALGARGIIKPSLHAVQVVLGPIADQVAVEIRDALASPGRTAAPVPSATTPASEIGVATHALPAALRRALGGDDNIHTADVYRGRLRLVVRDRTLVATALAGHGVRDGYEVAPGVFHLLTSPAFDAALRDAPVTGS
jgi:PTS system N-acetylglucosamine-specific IIC component